MKSPINQVLGLGSAKEGVSHWWQQRITAVAMVPLGLWLAIALARLDLSSYAALIDWLTDPITAVLLLLTIACLIYHSWLGIRVVVEDYVGNKGAKVIVLLLSSFAHAFIAVVCIFAILRIAFGAAA